MSWAKRTLEIDQSIWTIGDRHRQNPVVPELARGGGDSMRHPEVLYETPDDWGKETFFLSESEARNVVRDLRRNLGWDVSLAQCKEWQKIGPRVYTDGKHTIRVRYSANNPDRCYLLEEVIA